MKITKAYVGKFVELTWKDPGSDRGRLRDVPKGRAALATWREYGVIDDITDGVVRIIHSAGRDPGVSEIDEVQWTVVDEALIEQIVVFEPVKEAASQ